MKVVETKALYFGYQIKKPGDPVPREVKWISAYVIKQIIRMIQIKMLKDIMHDSDLWTPDIVLKKLYDSRSRSSNQQNRQKHSSSRQSKRKR